MLTFDAWGCDEHFIECAGQLGGKPWPLVGSPISQVNLQSTPQLKQQRHWQAGGYGRQVLVLASADAGGCIPDFNECILWCGNHIPQHTSQKDMSHTCKDKHLGSKCVHLYPQATPKQPLHRHTCCTASTAALGDSNLSAVD